MMCSGRCCICGLSHYWWWWKHQLNPLLWTTGFFLLGLLLCYQGLHRSCQCLKGCHQSLEFSILGSLPFLPYRASRRLRRRVEFSPWPTSLTHSFKLVENNIITYISILSYQIFIVTYIKYYSHHQSSHLPCRIRW